MNYIKLRPNSKRPAGETWTKATESYKGNKGVLCGENITVIDVDIFNKDGMYDKATNQWCIDMWALLDLTKCVMTGSNNYHFYFKNTHLPNKNLRTHGLKVEIKNKGSYVVAEGSTINGNCYERINDREIIDMPLDLYSYFVKILGDNTKKKSHRQCIPCDMPPVLVKKYGRLKKYEYDAVDKYLLPIGKCPAGKHHKSNRSYLCHHKEKNLWYEKCEDDDCFGFRKMIDVEPDHDEFEQEHFKRIRQYDRCKCYFEKFHFKIRNPSCFIMLFKDIHGKDTFEVLTTATLQDTYRELQYDMEINGKMKRGLSFINKWITDDNIICKRGLTFQPKAECSSYYNMFSGFAYEVIDDSEECNYLDEIFELIRHICGYDEEMFKKTLYFIGDILQRPNEKRYGRCLIFTGKQGTGKTAFWDWVGNNIIGKNWYITSSDIDDFTGRFASGVFNKLLCVMEEMSGRNGFEFADKLKDNITGLEIGYEEKYKKKITVPNRARFVMNSNNDTPAKIEAGDRRFEPAESSTKYKGDSKYWSLMFNVVFPHTATQKAFANHCLSLSLPDWKDHDNKVKKSMLISTVKPIERFMIDLTMEECLLEPDDITSTVIDMGTNDIYDEYKDWCASQGESKMSKIKVGKYLRKMCDEYNGISYDKRGGGFIYYSIHKRQLHTELTERLY